MADNPNRLARERSGGVVSNRRLALAFGVAALALAAYAWSVDFVTETGERAIYTADCTRGSWNGNRCDGVLVAGNRFRFRALKTHGEVLFWTVEASEPAGKFTGCDEQSGRSWSCPANADAVRTVTLKMLRGRPVPDTGRRTRPLHSVSKLQWLLLRRGISLGDTANE